MKREFTRILQFTHTHSRQYMKLSALPPDNAQGTPQNPDLN